MRRTSHAGTVTGLEVFERLRETAKPLARLATVFMAAVVVVLATMVAIWVFLTAMILAR